jgi:hypothetical protein
VVRQAAGPDAASITAARDEFRVDLGGGTEAGANGSFGGVRREINWDGTPDNTFSDPGLLPASFFNVNTPRGVLFSGPGTGFLVSADDDTPADPDPDLVEFSSLNPTYDNAFGVFSEQKLFTSLGSNIVDVEFVVAGTETPGTSAGFGAVFTDVDGAGTSIEYFDDSGASLANLPVPAAPGNQGLSFLGVSFDAPGERVAAVRITSGTAALTSAASPNDVTQTPGNPDLVVLDDFLYGEPLADTGNGPDVVVKKVPKRLDLRDFRKGVKVRALVSAESALEFELLAAAKSLELKAAKPMVILAQESLGFGSDGRTKLKPTKQALKGAEKFKAVVRVTATDRRGRTTTSQKRIRVG